MLVPDSILGWLLQNLLGQNGQTPAGNMTGSPPSSSNLHGGSMADGALSNQMDRDTAAQVPAIAAQIPNEPVAGPYLQFINYNPQQYLWRGSALIGMHVSVQGSPSITLTDRDGPRQAPVSSPSISSDLFPVFYWSLPPNAVLNLALHPISLLYVPMQTCGACSCAQAKWARQPSSPAITVCLVMWLTLVVFAVGLHCHC